MVSQFESELASAAFPQTPANLAADGVTRGILRGRRWRRVGRGLYIPELDEQLSSTQRILNCAPLLTNGSALAGWAAAYVGGVDWLDGLDPDTMRPLPIDILTATKRTSKGLIRYHFTREPIASNRRHGLAITSPVRTAIDGSRWADSVEDALVFLDAMIEFGKVGPAQIRDALASSARLHGLDQVREAATLMRHRVWSPRESRLRYCYQVQAGLPRPLLNVRIFDEDGMFLGQPDLFDPEAALATEFDGAYHRDREQHHRDNIREEGFESAGVTVVRADTLDLRHRSRPQLIRRMCDGHRRGHARDHSRDRWMLDPEALLEDEAPRF